MQAKELTPELPDAGEPRSSGGIRVAYQQLSAGNLPSNALAVVRFGLTDGESPKNALGIQVRLQPIDGNDYSEVWSANGVVRHGTVGPIRYACDDEHLFGVIELDEREHGDIASVTTLAYSAIAQFQRSSSYPHLLRMWNYLDAINDGTGDAERYRQFCLGRARGLAGMQDTAFPAATGIGHQATTHTLQIFWIAGRFPGTAIENPRQVSAYRYPRVHGPASPSFARATLTDQTLLISGTASIVGHSSLHDDDVQAQLEETLRNLSTLRTLAGRSKDSPTLLKAYVRDPADVPLMKDRLSHLLPFEFPCAQAIYLAADICRRELLLEIEGVQLAGT